MSFKQTKVLIILAIITTLTPSFQNAETARDKKYTIQATQKEISPNAGILPYFYDCQGNAYFLLGKEHDGTWADFGGFAEKSDGDTRITAAREFSEETRLVFGKFAAGVRPLETNDADLTAAEEKPSTAIDGKPTSARNRTHQERLVMKKEQQQKFLADSIAYITPRITAELVHPKKYYHMYLAKVDFIPADVFNNAALVANYDKENYAWVPVDEFMQAMKKATNRWRAYYLKKQIRRQIYDVLHDSHDLILKTIYPKRYEPVAVTTAETEAAIE